MALEAVTSFIVNNAGNIGVAAFYITLISLIVIFRKKFEFQGKIVALLRTNWGIAWMQRTGEKHAKLIRVIGYIGVAVAFAGMLVILWFLGFGVYQLIFEPSAAPVVSPVLPGVKIPGSPIHVPLLEGLLALFVVIVIHESAHGLVGAAHGMKIKSSGLLFLGPIAGAFVEPDEEHIHERKHRVQHSVFAAGPWSNILTGFVFLGMWIGFLLLLGGMVTSTGIQLGGIAPGSPAEIAGMQPGELLMSVNGVDTLNTGFLQDELNGSLPGEVITLTTDKNDYTVTLGEVENSDGSKTSCIGVSDLENITDLQQQKPFKHWILFFIKQLLFWMYALSFGLGLANLIPIGPVDGGRMIQLVFHNWFGEKNGNAIWSKWSALLLVVILALLFIPIIRALINPVTFNCLPI